MVVSEPCSGPSTACQVSIPCELLHAYVPDTSVADAVTKSVLCFDSRRFIGYTYYCSCQSVAKALEVLGDDSWKSQQTLMGLWSVPIRDEHYNHLSGLRGPQAAYHALQHRAYIARLHVG